MHAHTLGGSPCAKEKPSVLAEVYKNAGYGGVVLTNHYCKSCYDEYPGDSQKEKLGFYLGLYNDFKIEAEKAGLTPILGAEVRAYDPEGYFTEYLLYGFDEEFLYDNPPLFTFTQKELFRLADSSGIFMAQSHPFRSGVKLGFPEYMHGAEVYNGHIYHTNRNELAEHFAREYNLKQTSGTDFHERVQSPAGGIYVPDSVTDGKALAKYLFSTQPKLIKDGV